MVFVAGGTGYMGQRLIRALVARGHKITAVVRPCSEKTLPGGCTPVVGNVLDGNTYASHVAGQHTFVQLVGVAHPAPAMHAYIATRVTCEAAYPRGRAERDHPAPLVRARSRASRPRMLIALYWMAERLPATREGARRLGLVTIDQMTNVPVNAVENPVQGVEIPDVPRIRARSATLLR